MWENLARLYEVSDRRIRVEEWVKEFHLKKSIRRAVYTLGRGLRQRVAFAAALVHFLLLLILDERPAVWIRLRAGCSGNSLMNGPSTARWCW